ncbi:phage tail assembly chaperone [Martelella sp. FOR1707]
MRWSPETFWSSTIAELTMAIDAIAGNTKTQSPVSRARIREIVAEHGAQPSIRAKAKA